MNLIPLLTNYKASQLKILKRKYFQANNLATFMAPPLPEKDLLTFIGSKNPVKFLIVRHPLDRLEDICPS